MVDTNRSVCFRKSEFIRNRQVWLPHFGIQAVELLHLVDAGVIVTVNPVSTHADLVVTQAVAQTSPREVPLVAAHCRNMLPVAVIADGAVAPFRERGLRYPVKASRVGVGD